MGNRILRRQRQISELFVARGKSGRCGRSLWLPVLIDCGAFQDTVCLHHTPAPWRSQGLWATAGSTIPKTDQLSRNFGQISTPYITKLRRKQVSVDLTLYLKGGLTLKIINMNINQLSLISWWTLSPLPLNVSTSPRCRHQELFINVNILYTDDYNDVCLSFNSNYLLQLRNRWMLLTFYFWGWFRFELRAKLIINNVFIAGFKKCSCLFNEMSKRILFLTLLQKG